MRLIYLFVYFQLISCHVSLTRDPTKRFTVQFRSSLDDPHAVQQDHERFLHYLAQHLDIQVRYNYTNVMNGMSFELVQPFTAAANKPLNHTVLQFIDYTLSTCPYVHRYWPGKTYPRPKAVHQFNPVLPIYIDAGKPNLHAAHALTTVDRAKEAGWTGEGVKIGILDTGIDYTHPALGGCFGETCKVKYGKDLVGDRFNGRNNLIQPDNDPMDQCDGHGTHIAGIIAANDTYKGFEGVAHGVTLGAWRIFGCEGDTDDDVIIAAAEMAVQSEMDIINLSIGGGLGSWQEDPLAVALSNIAKNNITIVVAQGNEGKDGFARTPSPAIGEHLVSVGSVDNTEIFGSVINLLDNNNKTINVFEYFIKDNMRFEMETSPLQYSVMNRCQLHDAVTDNRVIIMQYDPLCEYSDILLQDSASILLLYPYANQSIETMLMDKQFNYFDMPVAMMNFLDGSRLMHQLTNTSLLQFTFTMIKTKTGGKVSDFSTWGPDPELHFKPDISAIGGYLYSTFPINLGVYATLSGTSMATPYLSGCLALLIQATGIRDSKALMNRLLNYAKPLSTITNNTHIENPIKQGSGLVQIYPSILGHHTITPSILTFNDSIHSSNTTCITIHNYSNLTKLFKLESIPSIGVTGYNFTESAVPLLQPIYRPLYSNITFEQNVIQINAHSSQNISIDIKPPTNTTKEEYLIYGGFLRVISDTSISHVPYFGVVGNQIDLPILDTQTGYPYLGDETGQKLSSEALVFNFTTSPWQMVPSLSIYSRIGNPTAQVKYELLNATTHQWVGQLPVGSNDYLARNDHSTRYFDYVLEWKGEIIVRHQSRTSRTIGKQLKNSRFIKDIMTPDVEQVSQGNYTIRISVLKILGDPNQSNDWQYWYSPSFSIVG